MYFDYEAAQGLIDAILEAHNEAEHGCHIVIDATPIVDAAVPKPCKHLNYAWHPWGKGHWCDGKPEVTDEQENTA